MGTSVNIISSKRSYEFRQDDLKLTFLSSREVTEHIRNSMGFQFAEVQTPPETFGPIPPTYPPGLVFSLGSIRGSDDLLTTIRSLNIEPQRIVIDVAGPSSALDPVFRRLRRLVEGLISPSDPPAIGDPVRQLDVSELSVQLRFASDKLLSLSLVSAISMVFDPGDRASSEDKIEVIVPSIQVWLRSSNSQASRPINAFFQLEMRSFTEPNEQVYYSGAPLDSDAHIALIEQLESAISS